VFIKSEGTLPGIPGHNHVIERYDNSNLPIVYFVESKVVPIDYLVNYDHETDTTTFTTFGEAGLKWEAIDLKNIHILVSCDNSTSYDVLPINRPSQIDALKPSMFRAHRNHRQLSVDYKGVVVMARLSDIEEDVDDIIENEKALSQDDRAQIIQAVEDEKQREDEKFSTQVNTEKSLYAELVTSQAKENQIEESSVKASLEALKVFKVYPKYEEESGPPPNTETKRVF
jgi:hypothetical protein